MRPVAFFSLFNCQTPEHYSDQSFVSCRSFLKLPLQNGKSITLIDYPSAGQEEGHKVSAWIRTRS